MKQVVYIFALPLIASANLTADIVSTFDSGIDGWQVVTMCYRPGYVDPADAILLLPCGGCPSTQNCTPGGPFTTCTPSNGGGFLEVVDPDGNCMVGQVQYWSAAAKFLGDQHCAAGGSLSLDVQDISGAWFDQENVILDGNGLRLVWTGQIVQSNGFISVSANLTAAEWRHNGPGGAVATESDLAAVLGNLTGLYIRAEYRLGLDTERLDNVRLTGCAACPGDLNGDRHVDLSDLAILLSDYGCVGGGCVGDLTDDGSTDLSDVAVFLSHYGAICP